MPLSCPHQRCPGISRSQTGTPPHAATIKPVSSEFISFKNWFVPLPLILGVFRSTNQEARCLGEVEEPVCLCVHVCNVYVMCVLCTICVRLFVGVGVGMGMRVCEHF